jgi:threonine/homoserine/homoserine lactone efflux protein
MGITTALLNPKVAVFYLSPLPQFINPTRGSALTQSLTLGFWHLTVAILGNGLIVVDAGAIAKFLSENPKWLLAQRWLMGLVLGGIALHMVFTR